ncbi:MAG: cupin domain-containing protein [Gemmatimonadetes bacterium]|nr:cupin domain-containing protein [Gemmatimonadota bacterium]
MPFVDTPNLKVRPLVEGFRGRFVHSERMTIGFVDVDAGARLPEHAHPHEQVTTVLAGEFELTVEGVPHRLTTGQSFVIPSNVRHSGRGIVACKMLDVFQPVRDDYRS